MLIGVAPFTVQSRAWLEDYQDLTDTANAHPEMPLIAAGDFNAIREHAPMRTLLATTRLQNAAELAGHGWMPTCPSSPWHPPLLGLDHILVSTDSNRKIDSHIHHLKAPRLRGHPPASPVTDITIRGQPGLSDTATRPS